MKELFRYQDDVLNRLSGKIDSFYLAGGTALAKFYFQHRESYDLDFFSRFFSFEDVKEKVKVISKATGKKLELVKTQGKKGLARLSIYHLKIGKNNLLKIDFVEDVLPIKKPFNRVNGINVLSLDDIYLRKLYAVSGADVGEDQLGKKKFSGGRQVAKDLFDLYHLSVTHERLSAFVKSNCNDVMVEGLVTWFRTFDRREMKIGLAELIVTKEIEFADIDKHFRKEIDELIAGIL